MSGNADPPISPAHKAIPRRFEGLDAYRGIAALLIVVFHAYQYSREGSGAATYVYEGTPWHTFFNALGVTEWFFVLSGFLTFLPFAKAAIEAGPAQSVSSFLVRRAIRILPVYYTAIILVWAWRYSGSPGQWADLLQHLTFTQVFSREHIFWTIGPSWALAVIVQFYLFVALAGSIAYRVCGGFRSSRDRAILLGIGIVALFVFSAGYKWWAFYVADIPETSWPVYYGSRRSSITLQLACCCPSPQ